MVYAEPELRGLKVGQAANLRLLAKGTADVNGRFSVLPTAGWRTAAAKDGTLNVRLVVGHARGLEMRVMPVRVSTTGSVRALDGARASVNMSAVEPTGPRMTVGAPSATSAADIRVASTWTSRTIRPLGWGGMRWFCGRTLR